MKIFSELLFNKNSRNSLSDEARLTQAVMETVLDGVITIDSKGIIQSFNPAAVKIFGYQPEEVIGKNVNILMPKPYQEEHDSYLHSYLDTGEKRVIGIGREVSAKRKDGSVFPMELGINEMNLEGQRMFVGTIRDISERKLSEQNLLDANTELEEFAYRTSHDLRAPLVSSIALIDICDEAIKNNEVSMATESLVHIKSSLSKLESLVHDILQLTETKQLSEDSAVVNIKETVSDILVDLAHMPNFARLKVIPDYSDDATIYTKKSRLALIFSNLISNAIKYLDSSKSDSYLKISCFEQEEKFWVTFEDNGIRIPEHKQQYVFQMFTRFHPKISYGSGLGLYMMKKSADILDGEMTYQDSGQGSVFSLSLPLIRKPVLE